MSDVDGRKCDGSPISIESSCCLDDGATVAADKDPIFKTCVEITTATATTTAAVAAAATATCLSNKIAANVSAEFNFPVASNDFFRYQHRSCLDGADDVTNVANCGDKKELSRWNQNMCAGWLEWGAWSACEVTETIHETSLPLLEKDPDLSHDVWKRYKIRSCNTFDDTCMKSPTLERVDTITAVCCE